MTTLLRMPRLASALLPFALAAACFAGDGPMPVRAIAPDSTYILVSADAVQRMMEKWKATPLQAFLETPEMAKVLGRDGGAQESMEKRLREMGVPEGAVDWPESFGLASFTIHDEELDVDEPQTLLYGDWGAKADGMAKFFDALIAEAVKKDGVTVEKDEVAGREVQVLTLPKGAGDDDGPGRMPGMDLDVSFAGDPRKLWYCRDGSRFLLSTDSGGLEDALEAIDGKRKAKLPDQADFRGAMDQLGDADLSVCLLTGPMQKGMGGEGGGMMALLQPILAPLFGDVHAYTIGVSVDSPRGQVELSSGIFVPGEKVGLWSLLGPAAAIEPPPPMIGPDALGFGRINVRFKDLMNLLNAVTASMPAEQAEQIDAYLVNFGPVLSKGFEAMGPGMWTYETVRQPVTPESRVTSTLVTCSNPKAVVPMITQFGGTLGLEPRDFDGNTIFSAEFMPISVGVANGWMATGDGKLVEHAMRSMGQKDLPSVAESPVYRQAASVVGSDPVVSWGWIDLAGRWGFERELLAQFGDDDSRLDNVVGRSDDSEIADRLGFKVPKESSDVLKTIDADMVAKYVGPMVWSMRSDAKGFVTRATVLKPVAAPPAK